ncbi:hypothetical protein U9K47_27435 [Bacillus toyonensis]|uniref:hypothetical protein n=1 Tax=Bacillus toyonensis TaxID=155322 RepID=UPI003467992C
MFEVPPQDWTPDKVYIKRKIHFIEPPSESEFPFTRIFVKRNEIELDPINGVLTNVYFIELRVDHVGILDVGPISLGAEIVNERHIVEVEFRDLGKTFDGQERPSTKIKGTIKQKIQVDIGKFTRDSLTTNLFINIESLRYWREQRIGVARTLGRSFW